MNTENTALSAQSPAATRSSRTPNWSKGDDIKLCEAWVSTSEDPIRGSDQKYEALWERILQDFKAREPERQRNAINLESCWRIIKKEVTKFCGKFAQVIHICLVDQILCC